MFRISTTVIIPSIVGIVLSAGCGLSASAGEIVVQLAGGDQLTAEVDPQTDGEHLWLVFRTRSAEVLRPVAWNNVVSARWQDQVLDADQLRNRSNTRANSPGATVKHVKPAPDMKAMPAKHRTMASEALELLF